MAKGKAQMWKRTVAAAAKEQGSTWDMILTIADEAFERDESYRNATSGEAIEELRLELDEKEISLSFDLLKRRAVTGVHVHKANRRDQAELRSVGWTIVEEFAVRSFSPEASAQAIRDCRSQGGNPTKEWARWYSMSSIAGDAGGSSSSVRPRFTDSDATKTVSHLVAQYAGAQAGEWEPSALVKLLWQFVGEMIGGTKVDVDLDTELRDLIAAEGGHG